MRDRQDWLQPTWFFDWEAPEVLAYSHDATDGANSARERAVRLFYAVRDGFRYDPYTASHDAKDYRASAIVKTSSAYCAPKAILLTAVARAVGVPARIGFADVRNHLATPKLLERLGTDVFVFHGYAELYLDGQWLKAAPTFNQELCERFGVSPQDFDGTADALLHPFDADGRRHMEYVNERGSFDDVPFAEMIRVLKETYGEEVGRSGKESEAIFEA
jgi:transglutaminase-like putative cysteine protease